MGLALGALVPHPPIIVPEVGGPHLSQVKRTVDSMKKLARRIKDLNPSRLIIITPHNVVLEDAVGVLVSDIYRGSLRQFGGPTDFSYPGDKEFAYFLLEKAKESDIPLRAVRSHRLDHATLVPLYYIFGLTSDVPIIVLTIAFLSPRELYEIGRFINGIVECDPSSTVLIASGDLSHRLTYDAPAGYSPRGKEFDKEIVRIIEEFDAEALLKMDPYFLEEAGECGYRSLVMLFGALDEWKVRTEVLSYEGPFGVGYCVAMFQPLERLSKKEHPLVRLARDAVEAYVRCGKIISPPSELTPEMRERAGVFVSLKKRGRLRGCIGTFLPACENVAEEVIRNAIAACSEDPRFEPVREEELPLLEYSVDILSEPELVSDIGELDPKIYGVIVEAPDGRRGLLLPDLEGVDSVEEQISIASRKAGIFPGEPIKIYRFRVRRYR